MTVGTRPPSRAHTVIAVAALAWNLVGLMMFVLRVAMQPAQVAALSPADRSVYHATPPWVLAAFGVAVLAGVAGSLGLLARRRWAVPAFAVSLVALLLQVAGTYVVTPAWSAYGAAGLGMPIVLIVVGVLLLRQARRTTA